jgi:16S rRNA processing protein RimM
VADADSALLTAGRVGRPHGLDGSFYVTFANPGLLTEGATVTVAGRESVIVRRAGTDARPIVRLEGCEDREAAKALSREPLLVPRTAAPALGPDEWWEADLVGCQVVDADTPVGVVRGLLVLPSCEALEVERSERAGETMLVPMVRDAIRNVDVKARRIDVNLRFVEGEPVGA